MQIYSSGPVFIEPNLHYSAKILALYFPYNVGGPRQWSKSREKDTDIEKEETKFHFCKVIWLS